jgi:serine/threonine-protein kinase RsbW
MSFWFFFLRCPFMQHARQLHTLASDLGELMRLTEILEQWGSDESLAPSVIGVFNVCLDEIITNIIKHGYEASGKAGSIQLELATGPGWAEAVTLDQATPFDPLAKATPDTELALEDRPIGGLGIHLVREMMDEVAYQYVNGSNRFLIRKNLQA